MSRFIDGPGTESNGHVINVDNIIDAFLDETNEGVVLISFIGMEQQPLCFGSDEDAFNFLSEIKG